MTALTGITRQYITMVVSPVSGTRGERTLSSLVNCVVGPAVVHACTETLIINNLLLSTRYGVCINCCIKATHPVSTTINRKNLI